MKTLIPRHILIVCDIEGSSGCDSYRASSFMNAEWAAACLELTRDVNAAAKALFDAGVSAVTVKDFHRTGYNLFTRLIDKRVKIISGYRQGIVPGMGNLEGVNAAVFIGMHASSGSGGHIAHTMTSRIKKITVNGKSLSEIQLFSSALSAAGIVPVFFSGCPVACREAKAAIKFIKCFAVEKNKNARDSERWREGLARAAADAVQKVRGRVYNPGGPLKVQMKMRELRSAEKISGMWPVTRRGSDLNFTADDMRDIYVKLSLWLYVTPFIARFLSPALFLYNIVGQAGIMWARARLWFPVKRKKMQ